MRRTPIKYHSRPDTMIYGMRGSFKLGNHTACSCAVRDQPRNVRHGDFPHQILVLVEHTSHIRQQQEAAPAAVSALIL